jgi:hypothetical protein
MLALLSGLFAALFSNGTAWYLALKTILGFLFITVLPIILNNFFKMIIDGLLSLISSYVGTVSPLAADFSGLAGFFIMNLGLPACFSVVFAAIAFKFTLRLIPFIRL